VGNHDDAWLTLVIAIIREHYMLYGEFPTVDQVRARLRAGGA
jgi:hypothetical protein